MRRVWIWLLAAALASAAPIRARATDGKAEPNAKKDAKAERAARRNSAIASELEEMKQMIQAQAQKLAAQQQQIEALEKQIQVSPAGAYAAVPTDPPAPGNVPAADANSLPAAAAPTAAALTRQDGDGASPLQFHIGSAYITPVGFMDFTSVWRSKNAGSGIGTNFAGIPYGNTPQTNLTESRFSMQNSRIGFRVDAQVKGAHVIGYMESDFLGGPNPGNLVVSSNSNTLRSRLYWVDISKGSWEVLGGQTWSLITPGRSGISPLPGNIFFSQNMDVNYQAGLVWGRIPELRVVYHPSNKAAFAVALDSPEQYMGGSAGGGTITLPAALSSISGTQLDNGNSGTSVPNVAPDVIVKLALDPSSHFHFEVGGVERQFRLFNPGTSGTYSATGGGGFINLGFDLFKGFRILSNNFWSDGGGRYIFGQAPDLIVRADGSPSLVHSGSTVTGFEWTEHHTLVFGYYGDIYISRNVSLDTNGKPIGYGFSGSSSGQNRSIQEATFGLNQTIWSNPHYGALNFISQYSYLTRAPWSVANGQPNNANVNMLFFDLRYSLPGSAPALK